MGIVDTDGECCDVGHMKGCEGSYHSPWIKLYADKVGDVPQC